MYADRFTAVLDACVLAPALKRNILLSLAEQGLYRARWSPKILREAEGAIDEIVGEAGRGAEQVARMVRAFEEACVTPQAFGDVFGRTDAKDVHVAATALHCGAAVVVTDNVVDFDEAALDDLDIGVVRADDFVADCVDLYEGAAVEALRTMRLRFERPELDASARLDLMTARGLSATAQTLRPFRASL